MPVLATLITIHFLGDGQDVGLLAPAALRERAESGLDDADRKARVLAMIDEYEALAGAYTGAANETLELYRTATQSSGTRAQELIELLDPLDDQRRALLERLVTLRGDLRTMLSEVEWDAMMD